MRIKETKLYTYAELSDDAKRERERETAMTKLDDAGE